MYGRVSSAHTTGAPLRYVVKEGSKEGRGGSSRLGLGSTEFTVLFLRGRGGGAVRRRVDTGLFRSIIRNGNTLTNPQLKVNLDDGKPSPLTSPKSLLFSLGDTPYHPPRPLDSLGSRK